MSSAQALGLVGGWLVDQAAGDPARAHPVALHGNAAGALERVVWRDHRAAGGVFTAVAVGAPTAGMWLVDRALRRRDRRGARALLLVATIWTATGSRSLGAAARRVGDAVTRGDIDAARSWLPWLVGRDPRDLDGPELCRAALESVAENTADAVVAPLLWGAATGPAGVVAHRCANTLDAMVGHRTPRHERFGWASARLDDGMAYLPARLTALLAAALAPAVGGAPPAAVRVWRRDARLHPSPNAGPCEAAFAGALGVRLGGENRYPAPGLPGGVRVEVRGPLGDGRAPTPGDVDRAVRLSTSVGLATAVLCAAALALTARPTPVHLRSVGSSSLVRTGRRTVGRGGRR